MAAIGCNGPYAHGFIVACRNQLTAVSREDDLTDKRCVPTSFDDKPGGWLRRRYRGLTGIFYRGLCRTYDKIPTQQQVDDPESYRMPECLRTCHDVPPL